MKIKKIISVLTTTAILATSLPMQVFAEDTSEPVKNGDRWAFRQAYVDMTRIVNNDGSYSFPKMELTEKIGGSIDVAPYCTLKTAQDTLAMGWTPSTGDLFADDWLILG